VKKFRDIQIIHHIQGLFESWCIVYFGETSETSRNYMIYQTYNKSNIVTFIDKTLLRSRELNNKNYIIIYIRIIWRFFERLTSDEKVRYTQNNLDLNNEYTYRKYMYLSKNTILVFNFPKFLMFYLQLFICKYDSCLYHDFSQDKRYATRFCLIWYIHFGIFSCWPENNQNLTFFLIFYKLILF